MHRHRRQITVASAWCIRHLEAALSERQTASKELAMRPFCSPCMTSRPARLSTLRRNDGDLPDGIMFGGHCRSRWLHSDKPQPRAPAPSRQQHLSSRSLSQQSATIVRGYIQTLPTLCLMMSPSLHHLRLPMLSGGGRHRLDCFERGQHFVWCAGRGSCLLQTRPRMPRSSRQLATSPLAA